MEKGHNTQFIQKDGNASIEPGKFEEEFDKELGNKFLQTASFNVKDKNLSTLASSMMATQQK